MGTNIRRKYVIMVYNKKTILNSVNNDINSESMPIGVS